MQAPPESHRASLRESGKEPKDDVGLNHDCIERRQYLTGFRLAIVLGSVTLVTFMILLDMSILGPAIPRITTEFSALTDVGWYVGGYNLAAATLQPLSGKLYTHFSNKYTYLSFTILFELGSVICGLATSSSMFIVGRVVAGLGAAGITNGSFTIISSAVPLHKSPLYTGILAGFSQLGIVAGPLIGGVLTEHVSWRWCFYINLPVGGAATALFVLVNIPEIIKKEPVSLNLVKRALPELDLIGFALFAPAAVMFLMALQFGSGNTFAWNSATVVGLFCGAFVTALMFAVWEINTGIRAMIPGEMLRKRTVWSSCIFGSALMSCSIVTSNWLPTYFQAVRGEGPTLSGVHILPSIISALLLVVVSGAVITRKGYYLPWAAFCGVFTAIGAGLISTWAPTTDMVQVIGYQVLFGAGRGAGMQVPIIAVQNAVIPAQIPVAMAILIFFQNLSTAAAGVISNTIFDQTLASSIPKHAPSVSVAKALEAGSGAGAVRNLIAAGHEDEFYGLLRAYSDSLRNVFFFLVGLAGLATVVSFGMGWEDVRTKRVDPDHGAQFVGKSQR